MKVVGILVRIRRSNQTFVTPMRGNLQMIRNWFVMNHVEWKESGREKRSRCKKKVSGCPCVPFALSFFLSRLANISFFTTSHVYKSAQCVLSLLSSNSSSVCIHPIFITFTFRCPVFPRWLFFLLFSLPLPPLPFLSVTEYRRRVLGRFFSRFMQLKSH